MRNWGTHITALMRCIAILAITCSYHVKAQLTTTPTPTLNQIANQIVGNGVTITSISLNCPNEAYGLFDGAQTNIGLNKGILLTTGSINEANGPNNSDSRGVNNGTAGDNQLDVLSGASTFDGCILEMDLIPSCDTLRISYVFGSEEYPEFVGKEFNDVFAFFISGPGITGSENVATLPNSDIEVSVNSVNAGTNNQYYVNNDNGNTIQYDGFTTVLEGKAVVQPCEKYHLKLAIADVVDGIYESGVFIEGNSVKCNIDYISADILVMHI